MMVLFQEQLEEGFEHIQNTMRQAGIDISPAVEIIEQESGKKKDRAAILREQLMARAKTK